MLYQADIIVIGAGPGGVCAAISAARENKKTILITDRPVLGGNSSSEIRVWARGATGAGNLYAEEMGIWGEMKLKNLYSNADGNPVFWDDVLLDTVLAEKNLTLFLNTYITDVKQTNDKLLSVKGFQMTSETKLEFEGDYFIDATGDGTIGALSGIPYRVGKESREVYGESYAPEQEERTTFGNTIFYFTQKSDHVVHYEAPDYAYKIDKIEEFLNKGGRIINERMNGCDYWWFETGGMQDTIADAQEITLDLKRLVAGVWNFIKNSGKFEADYLTLSWQGNLPGKRESRRMLTETVVRQQDVQSGKGYWDTAFYGGWYLDFHPSDGIHTQEEFCVQIPVQVYAMPFRCLYQHKIKNILFAGRNIGTSHVTFASSRIMNTCALSGQAAGMLAAGCVTWKKTPEKLTKQEIREMQCKLNREDVLLPGVNIMAEHNLAAKAQVTVSSVAAEQIQETGSVYLKQGDFLIVPYEAGEVQILLEVKKETALCYDCYAFDLPSKLALDVKEKEVSIPLNPGKQWCRLILPQLSQPQFLVLVMTEANDIEIKTGDRQLTGFLGGNQSSTAVWYPCVRFENAALYGEKQLLNGYNRPWKSPNLWISKEEEQPFIIYTWEKPEEICRIDIYFNSDLTLELNSSRAATWNEHHLFEPRLHMPPELVREFEICSRDKEEWKILAQIKDNWKRKVTVCWKEPVRTNKIMIRITSTYGVRHGEVFEVQIY